MRRIIFRIYIYNNCIVTSLPKQKKSFCNKTINLFHKLDVYAQATVFPLCSLVEIYSDIFYFSNKLKENYITIVLK